MVNRMAGKAWRTAASQTALTNSCPPCCRLRKYHVCHGFGIHPIDLDKQITKRRTFVKKSHFFLKLRFICIFILLIRPFECGYACETITLIRLQLRFGLFSRLNQIIESQQVYDTTAEYFEAFPCLSLPVKAKTHHSVMKCRSFYV